MTSVEAPLNHHTAPESTSFIAPTHISARPAVAAEVFVLIAQIRVAYSYKANQSV